MNKVQNPSDSEYGILILGGISNKIGIKLVAVLASGSKESSSGQMAAPIKMPVKTRRAQTHQALTPTGSSRKYHKSVRSQLAVSQRI
jgi:hypothetical protein